MPNPSPSPKPSTSASAKPGASKKPSPKPSPSPGPKPTAKKPTTTKKGPVIGSGHGGSSKLNMDYVKAYRPPLSEYKWNLPPHKWSLPTKPATTSNYDTLYNDAVNELGPKTSIEQYRRGRLWWYASVDSVMQDASGADPRTQLADQKFGFQFTWNPESYSTGVSLNTDTTPNVNDRFVGVAGAFPSGETISFNIRLDRTNDFASARSLLTKDYASTPTFTKTGRGIYVPSTTDAKDFKPFLDYYRTGLGNGSDDEMAQKVKDLMELGTVSDLEYLYKAVNGNGWTNAAGRKTSDIGYLAATLLRVDIGPLSYIGYILSLSVNHIAFNQDMTPIRTDVSISMNLMASAGQTIPDKKKA